VKKIKQISKLYTMANSAVKKTLTLLDSLGFRPLTRENVYNYYIPRQGLGAYAALAINVLNPSLVSKLVPKKDLTNILLISSLASSSIYLYGRPHLKRFENKKRGIYAVLGGSLFSMGSVLGWAILKSALPNDHNVLPTLLGLAAGAAVVKFSIDYVHDCDAATTIKN